MACQLPLAFPYPSEQCFETYLHAPQGVLSLLLAVAEGRLREWLYLVGAPSSGKTHLAIAVCSVAQRCGRHVAYIPLHKVKGNVAEVFDGLENADLVIIDALDAIVPRCHDEIALFGFHNRARTRGTTVIYCGRGGPDRLPLQLPDLRSRLAQCSQVALATLDDEARAAVLQDRARRRGLILDRAAIDWLLIHSGRELAGLVELLERLDRAALAAQRQITLPFLRTMLKRWTDENREGMEP